MTYSQYIQAINAARDEFNNSDCGWGAWERMCDKTDALRKQWSSVNGLIVELVAA